jgi:hypothetical protein
MQSKARRDSSVGIAASNRVPTSGLGSLQAQETVSSANRPNRLWGPSSLIFNGCRSSFPGEVKRPGREVNHSPQFSVKVKNEWSYTSTPAECSHGAYSEGFTFTFTFTFT